MSDILLQKKASMERCIKQARDYYARPSETPFAGDHLRQDAVIVNLHRACEQCIDMANHIIRLNKLGLPAASAESFTLLRKADIIDDELEKKLKGMVGFRNIVIHQYRDIDIKIVVEVLEKNANDLIEFAGILVSALSK